MSAEVIDGRQIAAEIRRDLGEQIKELAKKKIYPSLAAIIVGDDPASHLYVKNLKVKTFSDLGATGKVHELPADAGQERLLELIRELNADPKVHGILPQLPLPKGYDPLEAQAAVSPFKDVDGLHPENAGLLALGRPRFVPCTPLGVKVMLEKSGIKVEGAEVVVVGRSNLVGRPLSILLSQKSDGANATVTMCHTGTTNLEAHTRSADILIMAAGTPRAITAEMVKPGATVIDVGTTVIDGKPIGDVDFESVSLVASAITPVPGGVGPMTVAMLLSNTVAAAGMALRRS